MIYTAIDTFYLTDEELENSPSRKDGIDAATETTLRIYGCDLIQESGILLRMPQAVMATGQVLFHRFHSKKSFARFHVKKVAACCLWLASKLEECPKKARQVIMVFHRMECRRENLPIEHLDPLSKEYSDLKAELSRTERYILKEMGVICHVEHSWLGLACVFLFTIQWAAGFFTYWYPGGSKNSRANLMPWHVFFGVYINALAVVTVTTGILEKATFLQANHVISRYSTEALLINSLGILVVALGGFVILAVISPANKGGTFRESIE